MAKLTLKAARTNTSYTQEQVQELTGITKYKLRIAENGNNKLTIAEVEKLLELYNCDYNDIQW